MANFANWDAVIPSRTHQECPLCTCPALRDKYTVDGFTITVCTKCTLLFVRQWFTKDELGAYYASSGSNYIYDDPSNLTNLQYYFYKVRGLIESKTQPGRILDVGCSAGLFLDVMTDWERHGVEFPCNAADHARAKYGENIFLGTFEDYPEREQYFDCITLYDVFDHVRIPRELLEKCNRLLRPGGLLVVKVHDIGCLYARLSGSAFYAIIPPYHLFYYNQETLSYALTSAGFQVTDGRHLAHLLLLKTIFFRLARNNSDSIFYRLYEALDRTALGNIRVKKNLHDLITMFAVKQSKLTLETYSGK